MTNTHVSSSNQFFFNSLIIIFSRYTYTSLSIATSVASRPIRGRWRNPRYRLIVDPGIGQNTKLRMRITQSIASDSLVNGRYWINSTLIFVRFHVWSLIFELPYSGADLWSFSEQSARCDCHERDVAYFHGEGCEFGDRTEGFEGPVRHYP